MPLQLYAFDIHKHQSPWDNAPPWAIELRALMEHTYRSIKMVDKSVSDLQEDFTALKADVTDVAAQMADLLAKQAAAIDAEDLAALQDLHTQAAALHASLSSLVPVLPAPTSDPAPSTSATTV